MLEQRRKDQVVAVRSLIKRLLVYGRERKQENESLAKEQDEGEKEASSSQNRGKKSFLEESWKQSSKWLNVYIKSVAYTNQWPKEDPRPIQVLYKSVACWKLKIRRR